MLKPNIRGIPRGQLRLGVGGWLHQDGSEKEMLIRFRVPWRRNWVTQLEKYPLASVRLDRGGKVRILVPKRNSRGTVRTRRFIFGVLGFITLSISFVMQIDNLTGETVNAQGSSSAIQTNSETTRTCSHELLTPDRLIQNWLANLDSSDGAVQALSELQIGGVKSIEVQLNCGQSSNKYRATLVKIGDGWKLKKSVRLTE